MTSSTIDTSTYDDIQNKIDGESRTSLSGLLFPHASPCAGVPAVQAPLSELMDVVQAVQAMNRSQLLLLKLTREERDLAICQTLRLFAQNLESSAASLARTLAEDIGMPVHYGETRSVAAAVRLVRETLRCFEFEMQGARFPSSGNTAVLLGWTDPLVSFCRRIPAILAAGNAVCVKPSSRAPRTVARVADLLISAMVSAKLPLGLFAVLNGKGQGSEAVGEALLTHPGIKTIYWIGRSDAALSARPLAYEHGKQFFFAGSGRNPALLFQGFDPNTYETILDQIASSIADPHGFGPYRPSRLFVQESIYKATLERLSLKLEALKTGDPRKSDTRVGPIPEREAARFDHQLQLALSETGHLVTGGRRNELTVTPTLVRDLTNCSTLQSEELAGPWATIASFKYQHEALKYANTSPLGLAAYVLHPDPDKAAAVAQKLETSRVFFAGRPPWPTALIQSAGATKQSANVDDGIVDVLHQGAWRSTWIRENLDGGAER